jgi:pimeloyl-ACP methyl ester carboxylesterase
MSVDRRFPPDLHANVKGITARYWDIGKGPGTIILLHGIGASKETWAANLDALADGSRVIALDMIGFGGTDKPRVRYSYERFAEFLRDFMETLGIARATVVGHSLGGGIALRFTGLHPAMVEGLILVAPAGISRGLGLIRFLTLPLLGRLVIRTANRSPKEMLQGTVFDAGIDFDEPVLRMMELSRLPGSASAFLASLRQAATLAGQRRSVIQEIASAFPAFQCRTLVVWGQQDKVVPHAGARLALESIPNVELWSLEQCGHCPMFEHPDAFNRRVKAFLAAEQ